MRFVKMNGAAMLLLGLCSWLLCLPAFSQGTLTKRPNVYINNNCNGYLEYLPDDYSSTAQRYPLMIYLNGMGSTGDGSDAALENQFSGGGFPHEQARAGTFPASFSVNGQTFKFLIITPQFITPFWQRTPTPPEVDDVINYAIQHYRIDTSRIYLVGNSSGGGPVWEYAGASAQYANRLAAIMPFCGTAHPILSKANTIRQANLAVWAFHNEFDPGVPVSFTRDWVAMINGSSAPVARATVFPEGGHGCWYAPLMRTYTEGGLNVYQWLLQFSRNPTKAFAGNDQELVLPNSSATLSGSGTGPNGSVTGYQWQKIGGPAGGSIGNPSAQTVTLGGLQAGTYVYRLSVSDNAGGISTDDVALTVYPPALHIEAENWAAMSGVQTEPCADAGGGLNVGYLEAGDWLDYNVTVPAAGYYNVQFRLAAGYSGAQFQVRDAAGNMLTEVDVESTGGWQTYTTVLRTIRLVAGTQTLRIHCNNSMGWNFNWWEIIGAGGSTPPPANQPPVANAGTAQTIQLPQSSVTLTGSGTDSDGSITGYQWSQVSGPSTAGFGNATAATTSAGGLTSGTYVFRLTVTDNGGATASADVTVTVQAATPANQPPSVNAGADQTITLPQSTAQLTGTATDADGTITGYLWTQLSGPSTAAIASPTSPQTSVSGLVQGSYSFRLTATDNSGASASDDLVIAVLAATPPPSGNGHIEAEDWTAMNGVFTESTTDAGGGLNVGWIDYGDWMDYSIQPPQAGTYTFRFRLASPNSNAQFQLRKADGTVLATVNVPATGGWQNWQTVPVPVNLAGGVQTIRIQSSGGGGWNFNWLEYEAGGTVTNQPPQVSAGSAQNITGNGTQLTGTATDADGSVVSVQWSVVSGPAGSSFGSPGSLSTSVSGLVSGSYVFRLTATDNSGATASAQVTVTVTANTSGPSTRIEAENWTAMSGVQTESTTDEGGGLNVGYIDNGDWMDYTINMNAAGSYTMGFRVASQYSGGQFQVRNAGGTVLATVNVPQTGGWQSWTTVTANVALQAGSQVIRLYSSAAANWNINWLQLEGGATPPPPPPPPPPSSTIIHIEAENWSSMSGVQTEGTSDAGGGLNVGYIDNGDWMEYTVNPATTGTYLASFRVASAWSGGQFAVKRGDGTVLATLEVPNTGGWQSWQTITASFPLSAGTQTLRLVSLNTSSWNINWFELALANSFTTIAPRSQESGEAITGTTEMSLSVYPNPVSSAASLYWKESGQGAVQVRIYSAGGVLQRTLKTVKTGPELRLQLPVQNLPAGTYTVVVETERQRKTLTLVKL